MNVTFTIGHRAMELAGLDPEAYPLSGFERLPDGRPLLKLRGSIELSVEVLDELKAALVIHCEVQVNRRALWQCIDRLESRIEMARRGRTHITKNTP